MGFDKPLSKTAPLPPLISSLDPEDDLQALPDIHRFISLYSGTIFHEDMRDNTISLPFLFC
jgi:hypothetical protein